MAEKKPAQGLILTLGGAPSTPHVVAGLPGYYRPDRAVPVGGPGDISRKAAEEASKRRGTPVELVDIPAGDVDALRELARADRVEALNGLAAASKDVASQREANLINQETSAVRGEEG